VLVEDYLSFWMPSTFHDDFSAGIKHLDQSEPFDREINESILEVASAKDIPVMKGGIVATTPGPRFETRAEIRAIESMGANLVSMTLGHEAPLLGEMEIPHAALAIATNYACGVSDKPLGPEEVMDVMEKKTEDVLGLLEGLIERAR